MATGLRLRLRTPQSASALKAAVFAGFFALAALGKGGFIPSLIFLLAALLLYAAPLFRTTRFLASWLAIVFIALFAARTIALPVPLALVGLILTCLFWALLGVKDLLFVRRREWHRLTHLALAYLLSLLVVLRPGTALFDVPLAVVLLFLLTRELLAASYGDVVRSAALRNAAAALLAFLWAEALWAFRLLPLGFLNVANAAFLVFFIASDLALRALAGGITRRLALARLTLFVVLLLAIFATSRWSLP